MSGFVRPERQIQTHLVRRLRGSNDEPVNLVNDVIAVKIVVAPPTPPRYTLFGELNTIHAQTLQRTSPPTLDPFLTFLPPQLQQLIMPPKQVYGKRTKKTTAATSYAKLFTPDKDELAAAKSKSKSKDDAHKQRIKPEIQIEDVERQLNALGIQDPEENAPTVEEKRRARSRASTGQEQPATRVRQKVAVSVAIESRNPSLSLQDDIIVFDENGARTGVVMRKALEDRDANAGLKSSSERSCQEKEDKKRKTGESETSSNEDILAITGQLKELGLEQTSVQNSEKSPHGRTGGADVRSGSMGTLAASKPSPAQVEKTKTKADTESTPPMIQAGDLYTTYVDPLLAVSDQRAIVPFKEWSNELDICVDIKKIAEASYSEVYRLTIRDAVPGYANESVLKMVPLRMPPNAPLPNESQQKNRSRRKGDTKHQLEEEKTKREDEDQWKSRVEDVQSEVRLLQNLNHIPGFTNFRELRIVQGRPSATFARAWKAWNKSRPRDKKSQFPDPSKKTSYEDTQLWAVIEMQDAGTDCGKVIDEGGVSTIWEVWDIFWGVCLSVAKAEQACRFEHRDMHMDNICVRSSDTEGSLIEPVIRNPLKRKLGFTPLETTVIDYTLSRADIIESTYLTSSHPGPSTPSRSSSTSSISNSTTTEELDVAYLDLNKDKCIFEGDAEEEYQYEIYRYMWGAVYHNDPLNQKEPAAPHKERVKADNAPLTPRRSPRKHGSTNTVPETPRRSPRKVQDKPHQTAPPKDIWKHFHPKTNLVWAHFILYTLLESLEHNGTEPSSLSPDDIMYNIVDADQGDAQKIHKKAVTLHKILKKVARWLEPERLGPASPLESMRDLVCTALKGNWLAEGDVTGERV
jgi:serine/threonine-protein kinase haspin